MSKGKSVLWVMFSLIILACVVLGVVYRDWIKNKWNEITHPQVSGVITGYFKVTDGTKDNNTVFVMQITEDKVIVKNIDVAFVCTGIEPRDTIKPGYEPIYPLLKSIDDVEFNVEDVYYEEANAIRFSFAELGYGPFTLIPNYTKKTYNINSVNDRAKDYKVIRIDEKEFEKITTPNEE